jgi:hypothetical protein
MFDEYHDEINNIVNVLLDSFIFVKEGYYWDFGGVLFMDL